MAAIRCRDTKPEMIVRRALHAAGYRFAVARRVEGFRPDLAFTKRRRAIFVHGCFWHGHETCGHGKVPKTRSDYWREKLATNRDRDRRAVAALEAAGWSVLVLWECGLSAGPLDMGRLEAFLGPRAWPCRA